MTSKNSRSSFLEHTAEMLGYNTDDMCNTCQGFHKAEECPHPSQSPIRPTKAHRQKVIDELNEALEPPKSPLSRREEGHQREWEEQRELRHQAEARARAQHAAREYQEKYEKFSKFYDEQIRLRNEVIRQREIELGVKQATETELESAVFSDEDADDDDEESQADAGSSKHGDKDQSKAKGKGKGKAGDKGRKVAFASGSGKPKSKR